jgi:hypothetical protein
LGKFGTNSPLGLFPGFTNCTADGREYEAGENTALRSIRNGSKYGHVLNRSEDGNPTKTELASGTSAAPAPVPGAISRKDPTEDRLACAKQVVAL